MIEQAPSLLPEIPAVVEVCTLAFAQSSLVASPVVSAFGGDRSKDTCLDFQVAPTGIPGIGPNLPSFLKFSGFSSRICRFLDVGLGSRKA